MSLNPDNLFSLDIGTRSVVGVITEKTNNGIKVIAAETREHKNRAMLDGQIHNIDEVAQVVKEIKEKMEQKLGITLIDAAVAAAGRSLKTRRTTIIQEISTQQEISSYDVLAIEMQGVQQAQTELWQQLYKDIESIPYHCVGYSVVQYTLDGSPMANLIGQHGREITVEVIATFLPKVVVDSLLAVLKRAGLEMRSLTLEPIAAINVVIPANMRQLNLALIDIGAGTSDIAISAQGAITAYAMVPMAGDEITEKLCDVYLLDFINGEKTKRQLNTKEKVTITDVLGINHTLTSKEMISQIEPAIKILAQNLAKKLLELNTKAPQAVMLVGGGSLTPGLAPELARVLGLPENRVAIRDHSAISNIKVSKIKGPEAVTPLGIAVTAHNQQSLGFTKVQVNGVITRLFELHKGTVVDALMNAGINAQEFYSRPGKAITFEVNGKVQILRGTLGRPAEILLNGQKATLHDMVNTGDEITFQPAEPGKDAEAKIQDVVALEQAITVTLNSKDLQIKPQLIMNNLPAEPENLVTDGAKITVVQDFTLGSLLKQQGDIEKYEKPISINYYLNNSNQTAPKGTYRFYRNRNPIDLRTPLLNGDIIEIKLETNELKLGQILPNKHTSRNYNFTVNGEQVEIPSQSSFKCFCNGEPCSVEHIIKDGDRIEFRQEFSQTTSLIIADVLNHIQFAKLPRSNQSTLVLRVNGQAAQYTSPVKSGDQVEVFWQY